jgi:aspartate racemase
VRQLGIIGGMSWESSAIYYRLLNQDVRRRLGGHHSARVLMLSLDFAEIEALQRAAAWDAAGERMAQATRMLQAAGAQGVLLATNTMHRVAGAIEAASALPLLHIADATARAIVDAGLQRVGLLGTRFTMEQEFYVGRLRAGHGLDVVLPEAEERDVVHRVIYDELCHGRVVDASREAYRVIIERLAGRGAQGVILGCTEITMLVGPGDARVPLFDTTALHARAAVDWMLEEVK